MQSFGGEVRKPLRQTPTIHCVREQQSPGNADIILLGVEETIFLVLNHFH